LIRVADIEVEEGPVARPSDPVSAALGAMDRFGLDWTAVVDDGRLLGWADRRMLEGAAKVGETRPRPFSATLTMDSSLREALDSIVTSRTNVAVVTGPDHQYLGILTVERVSQEIVA
jgi:CBS domain-containing protein